MRAFLGLANYYRRFMTGYGSMAVPLTETTRKVSSDKIEWTETRCKAFEDIKQGLSSHPVLRSFMLRKPFILQTDSSGVGIGAILSQLDDDYDDHPVGYFSQQLRGTELRYTTQCQNKSVWQWLRG